MRKKYMNICLILGLLCLVYGLIVAIAGSGGTKFFIVWIGIAVILFVLAGLFHMGIWDRIFSQKLFKGKRNILMG